MEWCNLSENRLINRLLVWEAAPLYSGSCSPGLPLGTQWQDKQQERGKWAIGRTCHLELEDPRGVEHWVTLWERGGLLGKSQGCSARK